MSTQRTIRPLFVLLAVLVAGRALPQTAPTPAMTGFVHGEDGAAVAGALVTLRSPQHGSKAKAVSTDAKGEFRFLDLPPGDYTVTVERSRYSTLRQEHVRPQPGFALAMDVTMTASTGGDGFDFGSGLPSPITAVTVNGRTSTSRGPSSSSPGVSEPTGVRRPIEIVSRPVTVQNYQPPQSHSN